MSSRWRREERKQHLRAQLPPKLLEPPHWQPKDPAIPANLMEAFHNLQSRQGVSGIFELENQVSLIDAFIQFTAFPVEETKQHLREQLPQRLLEPLHYKPKDPDIPANNDAQKAHKRRREVIRRARQREETWKQWCFNQNCKTTPGIECE